MTTRFRSRPVACLSILSDPSHSVSTLYGPILILRFHRRRRAALLLCGAGAGLAEGVRLGACDAAAAGHVRSSGQEEEGTRTGAFQRRFLARLTAA